MRLSTRDRLHMGLSEIESATLHLRDAARHLDAILISGTEPPARNEQLVMLSDQLMAMSDMARGFGTALAGVDAELRGARSSEPLNKEI